MTKNWSIEINTLFFLDKQISEIRQVKMEVEGRIQNEIKILRSSMNIHYVIENIYGKVIPYRYRGLIKALETLPLRLKLVVYARANHITLKKVGDNLGVSRERIRQIENKAYRMLRHPSRSKIIKVDDKNEKKIQGFRFSWEEIDFDKCDINTKQKLLKTIDEMELSVRCYNRLKNENISNIGELIQITERELLKANNFGRKSLSEIKELLLKENLFLGVKVLNFPKCRLNL